MNCLSSLQNRMMKKKDYTYDNGLEYKMYVGYHNDDVIYTPTMRNGIKGNSSGSTVCLDGIGEGTGWNIVEDDGEDLTVEWIGYIYTRLNVSGVWGFRLNKGYLWFGTPNSYTKENALIKDGGILQIHLQSNTYYPIRILYGKKKNNKYGNLRLLYQTPTSTVVSDGTGVFVHI